MRDEWDELGDVAPFDPDDLGPSQTRNPLHELRVYQFFTPERERPWWERHGPALLAALAIAFVIELAALALLLR